MSTSGLRQLFSLFGFVPYVASAFVIVASTLAIMGWVFDANVMKSVLPGLVGMKINTAVALVLAALSLWNSQPAARFLPQILVLAFCGVVMLLGVLTLGEYITGINLGIDELLVRDITNLPGDIPGRMAVTTATCFAALGTALFMLNLNMSRLDAAVQGFGAVAILLGSTALIGYAYNVEALLRVHLDYTPMAVNTALSITLLGIGIVSARPNYPLRLFIESDTAAGTVARRFLPMAILFIFAAGWAVLHGQMAGYFEETIGIAILAAAVIISMGVLVLWITRLIYDVEVERKHDAEELHAASQYTRSLIEASLDPLVTISPDGKITDVNEATVQATGLARDHLIGTDFSEYFTEPDEARAGYKEVFAKGFVTDYPLSLRHVSGKAMEVLYNAAVYRNQEGEVQGVFAAARDITERKRVETELQAASLYARSLIEASPDPLVTISPDGKITDVNEATVQATGVSRVHLVGTDFSEYFTEPEKARAGYQQAFANGTVKDYPLALRHVSGKLMEVLYNASVYRNGRGEVAGVFAAARDITERKKAENELGELNRTLEHRVAERTTELEQANAKLKGSTAFLENLVESIPGPVFYKDRQGVYLGGNEAFFSYIGLPRERVIGQTVYGISPRHLADVYKKADDELMARGGKQVYESRVRYADGTEHDVIFHKAAYPGTDGSVGGLIGVILDISERKQHEQEREHLLAEIERRAAALDVANKDLEGFAYSVSHDLRVPLRAIDGFSHQLLKRYAGKLDDEGTRYLNIVRDNTRKMGRLIDDILAFSRMGRLGMSIVEVDMAELVNDVLDELKPTLAGRDVHIKAELLPVCHADRAMLRQVWMNLISNAIKFTRPRPSAHIEAGGGTEGNERVYFVRDDGVGFDMAYADKLFGVFQRLHGVEEFEGTGIGLAIVKRVIDRHGGRVWAESKINGGATFYFALPIEEEVI